MYRKTVIASIVALAAVVVLAAGCRQQVEEGAGVAPGSGPEQVTLTVVGPCGMIIPLEEAIAAFKAKAPNIQIKTVWDNSVVVANKVVDRSEPCDIFISPGGQQLEILQKAGLIDESSVTPFCSFELVTIVPRANPVGIKTPEDLLKAKSVSMPDADLDSVGYAGRQALQKLGLWDKLRERKLPLTTEHAIESHTWVASGKSQAGIAFANCPLDTNPEKLSLSKVAIAFSFPPDSYDQPQGLAAMTNSCAHPQAARMFLQFLASEEGQKILGEHGLTPLVAGAGAASAGDPAAAVAAGEKRFGDSGAKVVLEVFYPRSGHDHIIQAAYEEAAKYPGKVHAQYYDWAGDEADRKVWRDKGLTCGTIMIDGRQTWDIKDAAGERTVTFMMAMGGEWTREDLTAAVAQAVKEKYPGG